MLVPKVDYVFPLHNCLFCIRLLPPCVDGKRNVHELYDNYQYLGIMIGS